MTAGTMIDYEALAQEAMRGVVRAVLAQAAKSGLPGEHHFYISFATDVPGIVLSRRLKEKYPHEMTIVLQHRFWDLSVSAERFEVKLTFDGIPERLVVPYTAIKVFFDPSVRYGLQFEEPEPQTDNDTTDSETSDAAGENAEAAGSALRAVGEDKNSDEDGGDAAKKPARARAGVKKPRRTKKKSGGRSRKVADESEAAEDFEDADAAAGQANGTDGEAGEPGDAAAAGAGTADSNVVSLDAFRKK